MSHGPLFTMRVAKQQLRVGKPKEPVAILEIREPGPMQGQELQLTRRDLQFLADAFALDGTPLKPLGRFVDHPPSRGRA